MQYGIGNYIQFDDKTFRLNLPHHLKVLWLSWDKCWKEFCVKKNQIGKFVEDQKASWKSSEHSFYRIAAFLTDTMSKQIQLNISLQDETKPVNEMWQTI